VSVFCKWRRSLSFDPRLLGDDAIPPANFATSPSQAPKLGPLWGYRLFPRNRFPADGLLCHETWHLGGYSRRLEALEGAVLARCFERQKLLLVAQMRQTTPGPGGIDLDG